MKRRKKGRIIGRRDIKNKANVTKIALAFDNNVETFMLRSLVSNFSFVGLFYGSLATSLKSLFEEKKNEKKADL